MGLDWRAIKWRKLLRALHRDIGYVAVALTLAYAISGLAVNHVDSWNPSYRFSESPVSIGPVAGQTLAEQAASIGTALGIDPRDVRGQFAETAREIRVYLTDGQEVRVDPVTGLGTRKGLEKRAVLFQVNALHLNALRGAWTYVADAFAIALVLLAISGLAMNKGARGLWGRGKYFVGAGLAVPLVAIYYLYQR